GVAASGGYYASVSCDRIVAEPTAITGSIGVIMSHFVLQDLLENKLGIEPVVIKSGPKKDWPSYFQPLTEEQRQYLNEKLITPAYERFVDIVADGRSSLTTEDIKRLADGSIYGAQQALDEKMIDKVGYFEQAKKEVLSLAGISEARVVEYRKPLSLSSFLALKSKTGLKLDRAALHEMCMPQVLYLWDMAGGY
ncbi:S49 family peptidase, partial [Planctomycetota bacterium]